MPSNRWLMPEQMTKPDGSPRRVGIEIELQGIPVEQLAALVADATGGQVVRLNQSEYEVAVADYGDYRVEVDYKLLKEMSQKREEEGAEGEQSALSIATDALDTASSLFVPCEIVSPPLPMDSIAAHMDSIVEAARDAGAKGTRSSLWYAFGVHLNVEPTDMDVGTVLSYMRAFTCLFDWIIWAGEVDLSRRVTPYIQAFPRDYESVILQSDYAPAYPELTSDYLQHNPTRNRALDMLPLLSHVDSDAVSRVVDDELVKARPTFHYRLANSCIDEPDWSISQPWERWVRIEQLAADRESLSTLCAEKLENNERLLGAVDNRWRQRMQEWVERC